MDQWLSIREAALALGTSELTIRRRIKDGRLTNRLENGKYFVLLPPGGDDTGVASVKVAANVPVPAQPALPPLVETPENRASPDRSLDSSAIDLAEILREQSRLAGLAGQATLLARQLKDAEVHNEELQSRLVSLATRNGWLESKLEEREDEVKLLTDSRHRVPWWKRLFGTEPVT